MVTVACIHNSRTTMLLMRVFEELCSSIKTIIADSGFRREVGERVRNVFDYILQVVINHYKEQDFRPIWKRWMVERTLSWLDSDQKLCRNYETTFEVVRDMIFYFFTIWELGKNKFTRVSLCFIISCWQRQ